ncbi:MAG: 2-phospho-L-lactate/phosphoenolpyruvate guanylyltransferase [Thermoproteota archaeon]|nr:2-phospho-L-lactate/phosphoenolpyruvate guanylyltransferase [Thermoproteota archaeon]
MKERLDVCIIIPVKRLDKAKSRLSSLLPITERREFCLKMLEDVIKAVKLTMNISQSVVVSNDLNVLHTVEEFNVEYLRECKSGLNQAVSQAVDWCYEKDTRSVLILPIDIPLVTPKDLDEIISLRHEASMVISPSRRGEGTNALLLTPPNVISTSYGPQSFQRHLEAASDKRINFSCHKSDRIALDIDTIEDLNDFILEHAEETKTYKYLESIGIPSRLTNSKRIR